MSFSSEYGRRQFFRFLAASPLLAGAWAQRGAPETVEQAISLLDFEDAARRVLPPAHWGYMASGVDDDATIRANREGFTHFGLRPRRLVRGLPDQTFCLPPAKRSQA